MLAKITEQAELLQEIEADLSHSRRELRRAKAAASRRPLDEETETGFRSRSSRVTRPTATATGSSRRSS
jgi:ribosomal protein L32